MFMESDHEAIRLIAGELADAEILDLKMVHGGGNNRLYQITTGKEKYALKHYLRRPGDPRDRLGAEVAALTLLNGKAAPSLIAIDRERDCALHEWVDGVPVDHVSRADIEAALAVVMRLWQLGQAPDLPPQPLAIDAFLSGDALAKKVQARLVRLEAVQADYPAVAHFLEKEFLPFRQQTMTSIHHSYQQAGRGFSADLPQVYRLLNPSDFGFHNALRLTDGRLVFLDYEFFGWDDPVKLACDFFLHPGMEITEIERIPFLSGMARLLHNDSTFLWRVHTLLPLFGLCWCLIMLNEFLPEGWQRRAFTAGQENKKAAQARQLHKAQRLLHALRDGSLMQRFTNMMTL